MRDGGLRQLFREHLPHIHWQSIESGGTGGGIPDLNGAHNGIEFWVELKRAKGWVVNIEPEQYAWMARRIRAGGRCFIAVRQKETVLFLFPGSAARGLLLRDITLRDTHKALGVWYGGAARWQWQQIESILLR